MLDLITIENRVRDLDELLVELKACNSPDLRMIIYYVEEARDQLVNLHFLVSTGQADLSVKNTTKETS